MDLKNHIIVIVISMIMFVQLDAQILTDRPDQTESSSTVGNANLQIETGFLIGFEGDMVSSNRQILAPTTLFRYGVTKNVEIRFLSQFETFKNNNLKVQGISDIEIGAKIQLFKKENTNTEIAFLSHLIVPTGTKELTNDKFGTINKLSISHVINERVGLGYNVGFNFFEDNIGDLTYSLALGIAVNDKTGIYIEPYGDLVEFEEFILNFDAGFTYLANENLQFDFSFGTGVNNRMNYISIGFSWLLLRDDES